MWADNQPRPMARRNERCPCGSGRKYKVCHLGRELHPIGDRSLWLYHKMVRFVREQEEESIDSLAWAMTGAMDAVSYTHLIATAVVIARCAATRRTNARSRSDANARPENPATASC